MPDTIAALSPLSLSLPIHEIQSWFLDTFSPLGVSISLFSLEKMPAWWGKKSKSVRKKEEHQTPSIDWKRYEKSKSLNEKSKSCIEVSTWNLAKNRGAEVGYGYGILSVQILLTTLVSACTVFYAPINETLKSSPGLVLGVSILPLFSERSQMCWGFISDLPIIESAF